MLQRFLSSLDKRLVVTMMITASLCWSSVMALPPLLGWGSYRPEENGMR